MRPPQLVSRDGSSYAGSLRPTALISTRVPDVGSDEMMADDGRTLRIASDEPNDEIKLTRRMIAVGVRRVVHAELQESILSPARGSGACIGAATRSRAVPAGDGNELTL